jgi:hypothetical protein
MSLRSCGLLAAIRYSQYTRGMPTRAKIGCAGYVAIFLLLVIGGIIVLFRASFPTASYRYRLAVAVETDGQLHSGSSVIEVLIRFNPRWAPGPSINTFVRGQAVLIDLGSRGTLIATLHSGTGSGHVAVAADELVGCAFSPSTRALCPGYPATGDSISAISRMGGVVDLPPNDLPPFIWFSDVTKQNTARLVNPADFANVIGDATRLVSSSTSISGCLGTTHSRRLTA